MTVSVSPNQDRNTHHIKLSDGVTDVGLILCDRNGAPDPRGFRADPIPRSGVKIYAGEQRHSDLLPPWDDRSFDDWSGGMGGEKLEDDTSRFADGTGIDTTRGGQIILGPMPTFTRGVRTGEAQHWPSNKFLVSRYRWHDVQISYFAVKFTTPATPATFLPEVYMFLKRTGERSGLDLVVRADNSGIPGAIVATEPVTLDGSGYSGTIATEGALHVVRFSDALYPLSANTTYWLTLELISPSTTNYFSVLCGSNGTHPTCKTSVNNMVWLDHTLDAPFFRIANAADAPFGAHFAELKGALYAGLEYFSGAAPRVVVNGTTGKATAGAVGYLRDSNNPTITDDKYNGAILKLTSGKGAHVPSPWARVADTATTNSEIDVTPEFPTAPDNTTEYAVIGADVWNEVTGHGLIAGQYITKLIGANNAIYFLCGDVDPIKRLRVFWTAGTPGTYWQWTAEGTSTATFGEKMTGTTGQDIWVANRFQPMVYHALPVDCSGVAAAAALTWTAIKVGDTGEKITNILTAGESYPVLHVFKEGSVHQVVYDAPSELRIAALRSAADERNGAAAVVNDVYLYFSFLDSVERYYRGQIDDMGPARGGALPYDRKGRISAMVAYPGRVYAAIDAGEKGTSSIVVYNGQGWQEVWRAPKVIVDAEEVATNERILGELYIQPIPGDNVDRLWFSWNGELVWVPVTIDPYRHNSGDSIENIQYYAFAPNGQIELPWFHFGMEEIDKLFNKVTITGDNLNTGSGQVYLDYRLDGEYEYTTVGAFTFSEDMGSLDLSPLHDLTGRRIKLRLRIEANFSNRTPRITSLTIEGLVTNPHKYEIAAVFCLEDYAVDLLGNPDDIQTVTAKWAKLREWAQRAGTVAMSGHITDLNGKRVKIDAPSLQELEHTMSEVGQRKITKMICQMRMLEVD